MTAIRAASSAASLIVWALITSHPAPAQTKPAGKVDCFGDPLPQGALARLGTTRFTPCRSAAYSPDGKTVAVGGRRDVRLWDPATGRLLQTLASSPDVDPSGLVFSADGARLAVIGFGGSPVDVWDLKALKKVHFEGGGRRGGPDWAASAVFAADGKTLFVASTIILVHLDATTAKARQQFKFDPERGQHRTVVFSPDGKVVATETYDGKKGINLWAVETGAFLRRLDLEQSSVDIFRFAPDSATLAVGGHIPFGPNRGDKISFWSVATAKPTRTLPAPGRTFALAFSSDGKTLVSGHNALLMASSGTGEQSICVWDVGSPEKPTQRYAALGIYDLILSPDAKTVAWRCCGETLRFIDRATGTEINSVAGHRGPIQALTFARDGKTVASASDDGSVRLWDAGSGKQTAALHGHVSAVSALAYSPDGKCLASAGRDATVILWDPASGAKRHTLEEHGNGLRAVAFAPAGDVLAAGGYGPVLLWNPRTGKQLETLKFGAAGLTFSPDGRTLIAAQPFEKQVVWFDRKANQERRVELSHSTTSLACSPDGRFVAVGCNVRTVVADAVSIAA